MSSTRKAHNSGQSGKSRPPHEGVHGIRTALNLNNRKQAQENNAWRQGRSNRNKQAR